MTNHNHHNHGGKAASGKPSALKSKHRVGGQGEAHKGSHWDVTHPVKPIHQRKYRPATLHWDHNDRMHGVVKYDPSDTEGGAHFHVHDHEVGGVSHRDLTNDSPEFAPIPLSHIDKHHGVLEYHDEPGEADEAEGGETQGEAPQGEAQDDESGDESSESAADSGADNSTPGYFVWHGVLGRLRAIGAHPEHFDGHEWHEVPDAARFFAAAERISAAQAEKLAHEHGVKGAF